MTASQPVSRIMRTASSGVTMSPLPITGILTAAFTSAMRRPIGLAAITLLAGAGMQRDGLQAAIFRQPRHLHGDQFAIVPAGAVFQSERNVDGGAHLAQEPFDQRQIAEQTGAAVALHYFIHGAAEIDVEDVEAEVLADAGGSAITSGSAPKSWAEMGCSSGSKAR